MRGVAALLIVITHFFGTFYGAQGFVSAAFFGWVGLVVGGLLGLVLGAIRLRGGWQASLYAHWGLALGLAAPVLTGVR